MVVRLDVMTVASKDSAVGSAPLGRVLRDLNLGLLVASADARSQQKLRAVIVRRGPSGGPVTFAPNGSGLAVELIVLNTPENLTALRDESPTLDPSGQMKALAGPDITDVVLASSLTGERLMVTSMPVDDFKRVEQVATLEQVNFSDLGMRGSWVCRVIEAERLDALFGGRFIDLS